MAERAYIYTDQAVLAAGGTATFQLATANQEVVKVFKLLQESTGAFHITGIRTSGGIPFSNAASGEQLDGDFIADIANGNNGVFELPLPITVRGNETLNIDIVDVSGAPNTVKMVMLGTRDDGS